MSISDDDKAVLDGILLHAESNQLTLLRAIHKRTGEEVTLLCCQNIEDGHLQIVPVAHLVLGVDLQQEYDLPPELAEIAKPFNTHALEASIPGVDKPF